MGAGLVQTREHMSEFGRWAVAQRNAHASLRAYVHGFFASSSHIPTAIRECHLASAEVPLVVNFGTAHRRADPATKRGAWQTQDGAWIVGLHDRPRVWEAAGERHFMIVRFTPIGAHLFLGIPMHLLTGRVVDLGEIDSGLIRGMMNSAGAASNWADCFAATEALIAERITKATIPRVAARAREKLKGVDGRIAVGLLASEFDCSHRQLILEFQRNVGLTPKSAARLLRFNRAVRLMNRHVFHRHDRSAGKPYIEAPGAADSRVTSIAWADLAADCGYFDQPHFIKEFRQFAGATPSSFLQQVADVD
jgi:AraC-like DNA-binding protein